MKKIATLFLFVCLLSSCISTTYVSGSSNLRTQARFLTDRMAHELDFSPMQYDYCYEINYDFLTSIKYVMDDAVLGYTDAISNYYRYLDYRNDDLRHIMTTSQYIRFMSADYFYRPVYSTGSTWTLRVYTTYSNTNFYYFDAPAHYKKYKGEHGRAYYSSGFYVNQFREVEHFSGHYRTIGHNDLPTMRKSDFGVNMKQRDQRPTYNNYKNPNQNNRTQDNRYLDNSGNKNSPEINNRNQTGRPHYNDTRNTSDSSDARGKQGTTQQKDSSRSQQKASSRTQARGTTRTQAQGSSSTKTSSSSSSSSSQTNDGTRTGRNTSTGSTGSQNTGKRGGR